LTIFRQDIEQWYADFLFAEDAAEGTIRDTGLALSQAVLQATPSGQEQLAILRQIRQACILARDCRRLAVAK